MMTEEVNIAQMPAKPSRNACSPVMSALCSSTGTVLMSSRGVDESVVEVESEGARKASGAL